MGDEDEVKDRVASKAVDTDMNIVEAGAIVPTHPEQPADIPASVPSQRRGLSKAEARLRHLKALRMLTSCTDMRISLTEGITSVAEGVSAVDAGLNEVIVDEMTTPLGRVPYATLRGSNIIALDGKLRK